MNLLLARLFVSVLISFNLYGVHEEWISSYYSERDGKVFKSMISLRINIPSVLGKKEIARMVQRKMIISRFSDKRRRIRLFVPCKLLFT